MTPAQVVGLVALIALPLIALLVRDREALRQSGEMSDAWLRRANSASDRAEEDV